MSYTNKQIDTLTPREVEVRLKKVGAAYWKLYYSPKATPAILRIKKEDTDDKE